MNPSRAKEILDELDIEYKDVKRGSFLYVIMNDDSHIPFSKLLREHKKHTSDDVAEIMFSPTEVTEKVVSEETKAETEIIKKPSRKSKR